MHRRALIGIPRVILPGRLQFVYVRGVNLRNRGELIACGISAVDEPLDVLMAVRATVVRRSWLVRTGATAIGMRTIGFPMVGSVVAQYKDDLCGMLLDLPTGGL